MSSSMVLFYASSRRLSTAFADDLLQIRQAAYALLQYELWSLGCDLIRSTRLNRLEHGPGYELRCLCSYCNRLAVGWTPADEQCCAIENFIFRFGPYMLAAPYTGLEWSVDGRLYWPVATRRSADYADFISDPIYLGHLRPIGGVADEAVQFYAAVVRGQVCAWPYFTVYT